MKLMKIESPKLIASPPRRTRRASAVPITWVQYLLELQRDWARGETYAGTMNIAKEHAGGYGLGVIYAEQMFNAKEGQ